MFGSILKFDDCSISVYVNKKEREGLFVYLYRYIERARERVFNVLSIFVFLHNVLSFHAAFLIYLCLDCC